MKFTKTVLTTALFALSITTTSQISYANQSDEIKKQAIISGGEQLKQAVKALRKEDWHRAFKLFQPLAEQDNAIAQSFLGSMYQGGWGVKQDYQQAVKWYQKAAEQGYADAQVNLGLMYHKGRGVKQDDHQAFKWVNQAAQQGDAKALVMVGTAYLKGQGVMQDKLKAKDYFGRACEAGMQAGCDMYHQLNEGK